MDPQLATTAATSQVLPKGPATAAANLTPAQQARLAKATDVAHKFEAVFIQQMLQMSSPKPDKDDMFSGGFGGDMYRQSLNEQTATAIANHGGFGLADHILQQMAQRGDIPQLTDPAQARRVYQNIATPTEENPQ